MANQAREEIGAESLTVVADRGYYKGPEILACEQAGTTTFVPKPLTSSSKAQGRFGKQDFIYIAASDEYRCPAGRLLTRRHSSMEDGMLLHSYGFSGCQSCSMQKQCTTGKERRLKRWEHETVVEAVQIRWEHDPGKMKVRQQTVEHPFGTLKYWMGSTHFLSKTLPRVSLNANGLFLSTCEGRLGVHEDTVATSRFLGLMSKPHEPLPISPSSPRSLARLLCSQRQMSGDPNAQAHTRKQFTRSVSPGFGLHGTEPWLRPGD